MNRVIITGCGGFFGGALTSTLLSRGIKVYGVDISEEKLSRFSSYGNFTPVVAEFEDYEKLPEMIKDTDIDVFYHLAWAGGFTTAIRNYKLQMMNAAYAGDALTAAAKMNAKRFVYANTYNQYEIINFLESEMFEPRYTCIYSAGKTAASLICRTLAHNMGIEYSAGLIPMPYGENNYSKQLVNVVINSLNHGKAPRLVEGNNLYDLVYVQDIADALIAIGEKGKDKKEYYVGHRRLKTFREWMVEIRDEIAPEVELRFGEYKDNQQIDYSKVDLDALFKDTGWECHYELIDRIRDTAQWVKDHIAWTL
ncbi:MAG: NAD(P)-dependent oxidoreductase [Lachnospiraceae bacterium]|nr:NAD(P)-dependent oxidoreductase [Lachnospiraceae bacterium]